MSRLVSLSLSLRCLALAESQLPWGLALAGPYFSDTPHAFFFLFLALPLVCIWCGTQSTYPHALHALGLAYGAGSISHTILKQPDTSPAPTEHTKAIHSSRKTQPKPTGLMADYGSVGERHLKMGMEWTWVSPGQGLPLTSPRPGPQGLLPATRTHDVRAATCRTGAG